MVGGMLASPDGFWNGVLRTRCWEMKVDRGLGSIRYISRALVDDEYHEVFERGRRVMKVNADAVVCFGDG